MSAKELAEAMAEISGVNDKAGKGTTKVQGGKIYTNVNARVEVFRKKFGLEYGIDTQISTFEGGVLTKAYVTKGDNVIGSGHAYASSIGQAKSLEKSETVAIGRAMASLGLSGGEYATDNEIESWKERYEEPKGIGMTKGADDVPSEQWLASTIAGMHTWADKPKSTIEGLIEKSVSKREDPQFRALNDPQKQEFEEALKDVELQLKQKEK